MLSKTRVFRDSTAILHNFSLQSLADPTAFNLCLNIGLA